jgi:hypothetical protein
LTESRTLLKPSVGRLSSNDPLVLTTTLVLTSDGGVDIIIKVLTVVVAVTLMLLGGDPQARLPVEGLVLARKVNALTHVAVLVATALRKGARSLGELGGDGGVLRHPVGKRILTILDDAAVC